MVNNYLLANFYQRTMSQEDLQLVEEMDELPYQNLKCLNQCTTISLKHKNTCHSTIFDAWTNAQGSTDCSFEQAIHLQNVEILKNATVKYLEETIAEPFDKNEGFRDASLYEGPAFEPTGNELEILTAENTLLTEKQKQELLILLKEEEELEGLLKQLAPVFGIAIGKELTYIIVQILKQKLTDFWKLIAPKDTFLPRFACFHGFEEQENALSTACPLYEDFNIQQIPLFAEKELDDLCSQVYYSSHIKYLNLKQIKYDPKCPIYPSKFNALVKQISRTLFYSLAGSVEPTHCGSALFALDLSREVSFSEFPEGNIFSIPRSLSRPFVSCDDVQMDSLCKKLKFE